MTALRPLTPAQLATLLAAGACPAPDRLFAAAAGESDEAEREAVLGHAASCDACGAELELARAFVAAGEPTGAEGDESATRAADVDWIVAQLAASRAGTAMAQQPARVLPLAAHRRARPERRWLAAAASLLLAVGALYLGSRGGAPPPLPSPPESDVLRSGAIVWEIPAGPSTALPETLAWRPVPGAARYRLTAVNAASRESLWSGESTTPRLPFPAALRQRIAPLTAVELRIEALAPDGARLAVSPPLELRAAR